VLAEHGFLIGDQPHEEIISVHVGVRHDCFLVDAGEESLLEHVEELVDEGQLQDLLVDHREHDFQLRVKLPLQQVVLVAELLARCALVVL